MSSDESEDEREVDSEAEDEESSEEDDEEPPKLELPSRATRGQRMNKAGSSASSLWRSIRNMPISDCSRRQQRTRDEYVCSFWRRKTAQMRTFGTRTSFRRKRLMKSTQQSLLKRPQPTKTSQSRYAS